VFQLFNYFSVEDNIPIAVLLAFASEGDNALDGVGLATYYNQWAKLVSIFVNDKRMVPNFLFVFV
jgi:hypothetical protein